MPCRDEYAEQESRERAYKDLNFYRAAFCGLMTMLEARNGSETDMLQDLKLDFPFGKTGVSPNEIWQRWKEHKASDNEIEAAKAREKERKKKKKAALAKLSKEEKELLDLE